jgi:hypothetical protein
VGPNQSIEGGQIRVSKSVVALEQVLHVVLQLERTIHEIFELFVGKFHLFRHVGAVPIMDFPLTMANLGEDTSLLAVVVEEVEVVIGVLFVGVFKALFQ